VTILVSLVLVLVFDLAFWPVPLTAQVPELSTEDTIVVGFKGDPGDHQVPSPWKVMVNTGTPHIRIISTIDEPSGPFLFLRAADASFSVNREVTVDVRRFRHLKWRWKADELPVDGDVRTKRNDQVLQVFLIFDGSNFWGRKVLSYVWDSTAPIGTEADESVKVGWMGADIKVLVVTTGEHRDQWVTISRDVVADFRELFGKAPPRVKAVRIQSNSQHTATVGSGYVTHLRFSLQPFSAQSERPVR
jgi:hypothetical protein